jgi:hypothetical protein
MKVIAIGVLAGVVAAFALRASGRFPAHAVAPAPRTAEQIKTDELFRINAPLPTDPELEAQYRAINAQYFYNRLPLVRLRWEKRLDEVGPLVADGFRMDGVTDRQLILLNPVLQDDEDEFRRVLCHEIVRVAVVSEKEPHGPIFQGYLRQLLDKGAFKGIVASDEEKTERRQFLQRRTTELSDESAALGRQKSDIEAEAAAPGARPEEVNAHIVNYNASVRRHNDAVVEFNHAVEDYNQMISYPDGLDRERFAARASVAAAAR